MILGIDIGYSNTRVAVYSKEPLLWEDSAWLGPIPSLAVYQRSNGALSFGSQALAGDPADYWLYSLHELAFTPNPQLPPGIQNPADILVAFFEFLLSQLPDIHENAVESATISIPNYIGIPARHRLITALQLVFTEAETHLLPKPLSALLGYQALHPQPVLDGDVLLIDIDGGSPHFSFISSAGPGGQWTLETQIRMGQEANLESLVETSVKPRAASLGLYDRQGWHLNHILLLDQGYGDAKLLHSLEALIPGVALCRGHIDRPYAAVGNCMWQAIKNHLCVIYPFKFYLERNSPDEPGHEVELIPFDTANLELDLTGRYCIASLPVASDFYRGDSDHVDIKIYQLPSDSPEVALESITDHDLVLHWREPYYGEAGLLDIEFDVSTSQLFVNFNSALLNPPDIDLWADWPSRQLSRAKWLSQYKNVDQELIKALQNQFDTNSNNGSQLRTSYYKLLCILQIMNP